MAPDGIFTCRCNPQKLSATSLVNFAAFTTGLRWKKFSILFWPYLMSFWPYLSLRIFLTSSHASLLYYPSFFITVELNFCRHKNCLTVSPHKRKYFCIAAFCVILALRLSYTKGQKKLYLSKSHFRKSRALATLGQKIEIALLQYQFQFSRRHFPLRADASIFKNFFAQTLQFVSTFFLIT